MTSKTTPAKPRTIRPLVSRLRVKYLFISFGVCLSSNYSAISKCPVSLFSLPRRPGFYVLLARIFVNPQDALAPKVA